MSPCAYIFCITQLHKFCVCSEVDNDNRDRGLLNMFDLSGRGARPVHHIGEPKFAVRAPR